MTMSHFNLRPYQVEFLEAVKRDFREHKHILGVAATGAGKTILASELMRSWDGNCLFLADAQELVRQNADKFFRYAGEFAGVEMAHSKAIPGERIVIATTQSICRRLEKWPRDYFSLIIVDEAHRNTLGAMAAQVLVHFDSAKVLGVTATVPLRPASAWQFLRKNFSGNWSGQTHQGRLAITHCHQKRAAAD